MSIEEANKILAAGPAPHEGHLGYIFPGEPNWFFFSWWVDHFGHEAVIKELQAYGAV